VLEVFRPSVLWVAMLLSAPAMWSGFVTQTMGATEALVRFLIAIPVAALMLALLRTVTANYGKRAAKRSAPDGAAASAGRSG
jgi:hypothetical protein